MPRIRQNAERDAIRDFQSEVNAQCGRYGYKSQKSLGNALGVCQATAGNYLKNPDCIQFGTLRAMVKLLRLDPMVILKALGYSAKDIQKLKGGPVYDPERIERPVRSSSPAYPGAPAGTSWAAGPDE